MQRRVSGGKRVSGGGRAVKGFSAFVSLRASAAVACVAVVAAVTSCVTDSTEEPSRGGGGSAIDAGGAAETEGGVSGGGGKSPGDPMIDLGGAITGGEPGAGGACTGSITKGEPIPLDIHVMLDSSGSMIDPLDDETTKWDAVKKALSDFIQDDESAGLGVGIQYFPLQASAVPSSCKKSDDCGDGGECITKYCQRTYAELGIFFPCEMDAFCPVGGSCVPIAHCVDAPTKVCTPDGGECGPDDTCAPANGSTCEYVASCDAADYSSPEREISELPGGAEALLQSISDRRLNGDTPTAPALAGVIEHASAWASQHRDHKVVALFATDGVPSRCDEQTISGIAGLAKAGVDGDPSILTYVIGVFAPTDVDAESNLDTIAEAGGTTQAFMVHTDEDVAAQFRQALEAIRGTRLSCEFTIPEPPAGERLDYGRVNVRLAAPSGSATFPYVASIDACTEDGGWYYDTDPETSVPTRIISCPATCAVLEAPDAGEMQIELGCETITSIVK